MRLSLTIEELSVASRAGVRITLSPVFIILYTLALQPERYQQLRFAAWLYLYYTRKHSLRR